MYSEFSLAILKKGEEHPYEYKKIEKKVLIIKVTNEDEETFIFIEDNKIIGVQTQERGKLCL